VVRAGVEVDWVASSGGDASPFEDHDETPGATPGACLAGSYREEHAFPSMHRRRSAWRFRPPYDL
jgi:hypothetical protein